MVRNLALCDRVLEAVRTMEEAASYMRRLCKDGGDFFKYASLMEKMLDSLRRPVYVLQEEEPALMTGLMRENIEYALAQVEYLYRQDPEKAARKIEFGLLPIIQETYMDLLFFGTIYPDRSKMAQYYKRDVFALCGLPPHVAEAEKRGSYKYDLSIAVIAYNHLDLTVRCVDSLLRVWPEDIRCELILYNNGSSDGTEKYFAGIHASKQIDIKKGVKSISLLGRVTEGKYLLFVSNDVILTPNSIQNLKKCMDSDDRIAAAVPACPNVSNAQDIPAVYHNMAELFAFARQNNVSDPCRWEQRARLIPPVVMLRSNVLYAYSLCEYAFMHTEERFLSFPDDKMSMLLRRNGYKLMLCKDAYIYHVGSATVKAEADKKQNYYQREREKFIYAFGTDPWGTGFCFSSALMRVLDPREKYHVNILGINCGIGDNPLHLKQLLKENVRNTDVTLYQATDNDMYAPDEAGVSDAFQLLDAGHSLADVFPGVVFHYAVLEENLTRLSDPAEALRTIYGRLADGGKLAVCLVNRVVGTDNTSFEEDIRERYQTEKVEEVGIRWLVIAKKASSKIPASDKRAACQTHAG